MTLALTQALPCSICNRRPLWHLRMRNTLRCPSVGLGDDADCDQPLTRSSQPAAVEAWNERHSKKDG